MSPERKAALKAANDAYYTVKAAYDVTADAYYIAYDIYAIEIARINKEYPQ